MSTECYLVVLHRSGRLSDATKSSEINGVRLHESGMKGGSAVCPTRPTAVLLAPPPLLVVHQPSGLLNFT
jgi:hypothetical protein